MKKYYFQSVFRSLIYLFISLFLIGLIVLCFFADEIHAGVIFVITFLSISVVAISFWFGFSLSLRIQIDYKKKELYIKYPYLIKKIKFEDVINIYIKDYNVTSFDFKIVTKDKTISSTYARYYKKRPSKKILDIINELKQDLMNISNKNY